MFQNRLRLRRHLDVSTSPVDSRRHKKETSLCIKKLVSIHQIWM